MTDTVLVRVDSHRARARMLRITGPLQSWFSWDVKDGEWYYVPAEHADAVLAIKSIRRARPRTDLQRHWSFR